MTKRNPVTGDIEAGSTSKGAIAALVLIAILAVSGGAFAVYTITSNHVTGTPQPLPVQATLSLTPNSTAPFVGDTLQLTAQVSSNTPGIAITLTNHGATVGDPVTTDANGTAVFNVVVYEAYDFVAVGQHP